MKYKMLSREISKATNYIKANYNKNINLKNIAENVNLNPAYLSSLFKKELGINFIDYLNGLRVEKARELLLETNLMTYEIAENVGFSEETYFSKVFKSVVGTSPTEFRKNWTKG